MKKLAFIINPISGVGKKNQLPLLIQKNLDHTKFQFQIFHTKYRGHATEIAKEIALQKTYDIIAVVGGDGSINEVGRALVFSDIAMAIIPTGSGNGFARHFGIPCDIKESIKYLNQSEVKKVDTGKINEHHFFATCGLGFDARVTHRFDEIEKRGFFGYVKAIYKELGKCTNIPFSIREKDPKGIDIQALQEDAFVLTVANTSQYGNNFSISPNSDASDGQLELILVKKPSWIGFPEFLYKSFSMNLFTYKKWKEIKGEAFYISTKNRKGHIDGDPILLEKNNEVKVLPKSLSLMLI